MTTTITNIQALPGSPFQGSGLVGVVITNGLPSYFELNGVNLDQIVSIQWLPVNPSSVIFEMRQLILLDSTRGTFMIRVLDNLLSTTDRAGKIIFRLADGTTLSEPVKTYGPVTVGSLWTSPNEGLITG